MTTTEENLDNQRLRLENDNQEDKKEENIQDIEKTEGNNLATEAEAEAEGGSSSSCIKPKILIPIIIAAVVVIVVVVVLVVVLTKDDDDEDEDEANNDNDDSGDIGDERWVEVYKKAQQFLEPFTEEEKYALFYGDYNVDKTCVGGISPIPDRGFPGICLQDGPAGVRPSASTTTWHAAINSAATFNRDLVYEIGKAQGGEFKEKGVDVMLTPCINIMKHPKGGRIWETFGEDPFLTGELAAKIIEGMQSAGVMACAKHYVGNEHETWRRNSSSNIYLKKLYLKFILNLFIKQLRKVMLLLLWNLIMQLMVHL